MILYLKFQNWFDKNLLFFWCVLFINDTLSICHTSNLCSCSIKRKHKFRVKVRINDGAYKRCAEDLCSLHRIGLPRWSFSLTENRFCETSSVRDIGVMEAVDNANNCNNSGKLKSSVRFHKVVNVAGKLQSFLS